MNARQEFITQCAYIKLLAKMGFISRMMQRDYYWLTAILHHHAEHGTLTIDGECI